MRTHFWTDETGALVATHTKRSPTSFPWEPVGAIQKRPELIYKVADVVAAVAAQDKVIWIAEGEKDADNLAAWTGCAATTGWAGAGKWKPEQAEWFRGYQGLCKIVADNDAPGYNEALLKFRSLRKLGVRAQVFAPPPHTKDVSELGSVRGLQRVKVPDLRQRITAAEAAGQPLDYTDFRDSDPHILEHVVREDPGVAKRASRFLDMVATYEARGDFRQWLMEQEEARGKVKGKSSAQEFLFDPTDPIRALWGRPDQVLHAKGELLLLVGDDGVGKSTLLQQLCLLRVGVDPRPQPDEDGPVRLLSAGPHFLGYPVEPLPEGEILVYLAMDRPAQIKASMRRMVERLSPEQRRVVSERIVFWTKPIPVDVLGVTSAELADWLHDEFGPHVGQVAIDSLKDVGSGLATDEAGSRLYLALNKALSRGVEVVAAHHPKKFDPKANSDRRIGLDDIYGSRWIRAGAGSILAVNGQPGATEVEVVHLKQPRGKPVQFLVRHDHTAGLSSAVQPVTDLRGFVQSTGDTGATLKEIARAVFASDGDAAVQKVKRRMRALVADGEVKKVSGSSGGAGGTTADRYVFLGVQGAEVATEVAGVDGEQAS